MAAYFAALSGGSIDTHLLIALMHLTYVMTDGIGYPGQGYWFTFNQPIDPYRWGRKAKFDPQTYDGPRDEKTGLTVLVDGLTPEAVLESEENWVKHHDDWDFSKEGPVLDCSVQMIVDAKEVWERYYDLFHEGDHNYAKQDTKAA